MSAKLTCALAALASIAAARGETATLGAARDTTLFESGEALSNGAGSYLFAGSTGQAGGPATRGLLFFDVAGAVPSGATITSVRLTLHMSRTSPAAGQVQIALRRVTRAWGEAGSNSDGLGGGGGGGGVGAPADVGDATWRYNFFDSSQWASLGGDFATAVSASANVNDIGPYTWGSTSAMVSDTQAWLNNPASNFGWILIGDESVAATAKRFGTREGIAAERPVLVLEYDSPITDCNGNGVADALDVANGTSADCDGNGVPDECQPDGDGDGAINACDGCPNDGAKTSPGDCGCGVADADSDGDGVPDCLDGCPDDPDKAAPGACGCGLADQDSDGDGALDCDDGCPDDPDKIAPGACGCGADETDSDGDGTPDCVDGCPDDPAKTNPGALGCGVAEADTDGDGVPDSVDLCPGANDNLDADNDDVPDCADGCPDDSAKTEPGACGCGVAEEDVDGDGVADCDDECPDDPDKVVAGECGCGEPEVDSDADGSPDCVDACPEDAEKTAPGACGCGVGDSDEDADGAVDCLDNCPETPNTDQADADGDGVGDACEAAPPGDGGDGDPNGGDGGDGDPNEGGVDDRDGDANDAGADPGRETPDAGDESMPSGLCPIAAPCVMIGTLMLAGAARRRDWRRRYG